MLLRMICEDKLQVLVDYLLSKHVNVDTYYDLIIEFLLEREDDFDIDVRDIVRDKNKLQYFIDHLDDSDKSALGQYIQGVDPINAPSWSHFDLLRIIDYPIWLVHFSYNAENIAASGFTIGLGDISKLGLTAHIDNKLKSGGYNFAFVADPTTASGKAAIATSKNHKHGNSAVMFKSTGIEVYHYVDDENQVIFYGPDVNKQDMILLKSKSNIWYTSTISGEYVDIVNRIIAT